MPVRTQSMAKTKEMEKCVWDWLDEDTIRSISKFLPAIPLTPYSHVDTFTPITDKSFWGDPAITDKSWVGSGNIVHVAGS